MTPGAAAERVGIVHFRERHETHVAAEPAVVGAAVRRLDLSRSTSVRILLALRGMPRRGGGLDGLLRTGFVVLEDEPDRTLRLGLIGRFWMARGGLRRFRADEFDDFDEPGYAKAVWSFDWHPAPGGTRLTTETTVHCTDEGARRRFGRYWRLVAPFSGWIRRRALAAIRADAEAAAVDAGPPASGARLPAAGG